MLHNHKKLWLNEVMHQNLSIIVISICMKYDVDIFIFQSKNFKIFQIRWNVHISHMQYFQFP